MALKAMALVQFVGIVPYWVHIVMVFLLTFAIVFNVARVWWMRSERAETRKQAKDMQKELRSRDIRANVDAALKDQMDTWYDGVTR